MKRLSYKQSVEGRCFGCGYDPYSCGTWREQVACCVSVDCDNFFNRPMPRQCRNGREHNEEEIAKVRAKVDRLIEARAERERNRWKQANLPSFDEENP
jgi:hypothetical protein